MRLVRFVSVCALVFASSCLPMNVAPVNPRPNIDLAHHTETLGLSLPNLAEPLKIPSRNGLRAFNLKDVQGALVRGFTAGFGRSFTIKDDRPDLILQVYAFEVEFVATSSHTTAAQVRFQARVVRDGKIVDRFAATVESKKSVADASVEPALESAIETMYEVIADKLFTHATPSAPTDAAPATSNSGTDVLFRNAPDAP